MHSTYCEGRRKFMPARIFISYRRDDVAGDARGIRDGLAARFGRGNVFMDVDDLLVGQRFDEELARALDACDVLIAVIGPRWMELLRAKTASGERDYVREEIAEALRRRIVVIPVRVGREDQMPALPRPAELPEDLRDLVLHQKHDVAHERFGRDLAELARAIADVRRALQPKRSIPWFWVGATAALIAMLCVRVYFDYQRGAFKSVEPNKPVAIVPPVPKFAPAPSCTGIETLVGSERRCLRPGDSFRDCSACPEMVVVPAGEFMMGTSSDEIISLTIQFPMADFKAPFKADDFFKGEQPQHRVRIAKPLAVGKFEVTFAAWDACVAGGGCVSNRSPNDRGMGKGRRPVINVSWDDAKDYIEWLSKATGKAYRLLTEAEWEYAARAGTTTNYAFGDKIAKSQVQFSEGAPYSAGMTAEVGSFPANRFRLHDMHGNVEEWVEDCWNGNYRGAPADGSARVVGKCDRHVLRGGNWVSNETRYLRSANRNFQAAGFRSLFIGFRVARTL